MLMSETEIVQLARLEASKLGYTLFRNNTGALKDARGRWVQFGLCKGSADLVGWHNKTGRFVAIECKMPGKKPTQEQHCFIDAVNKAGGIAGWITSIEDLKKILT